MLEPQRENMIMTVQPKDSKTPPPSSKKEPDIALALMPPGKYEVTPDQTFEVVLYVREYKGRWVITDRQTSSVEHKVIFRVWTFDEMIDLKRRATNYDPARRSNVTDVNLLNRLKIQKLLVSWTFSEENKRLEIQHVGGVLTDESWSAFRRLSPAIASKIIDEMNLVLDYGG